MPTPVRMNASPEPPRLLEQETPAPLDSGTVPRSPWPHRILLATDGSASSDAAVVAARVLSNRSGGIVETVAIFAPRVPLPAAPTRHGIAQCESSDRGEAARLIAAVRKQRVRLLPEREERRDWLLRIEVGDPGATLVRVATEISADLIILGIGQADPLDRRAAGHLALCAARYAIAPLYAAARDCEAPVRCVVVLPDGRAHAPSLRAAIACLPPGSNMWLAFPDRSLVHDPEAIETRLPADLVARLCGSESAEAVKAIDLARVDIVGEMPAGVLHLADSVRAQLIVVPNHGVPGPVRVFLPNLAEPLLLGARCSVLVVPDLD